MKRKTKLKNKKKSNCQKKKKNYHSQNLMNERKRNRKKLR